MRVLAGKCLPRHPGLPMRYTEITSYRVPATVSAASNLDRSPLSAVHGNLGRPVLRARLTMTLSLNGHRPLTVGVLALQGDFREHREILESMGHTVNEIRKPEQLAAIDALIIPGGESTTIARLILSNGFQQPLRDFCASGRAVWGTCAGAILLAKQVDNLDRPGIEVMDIAVRRNAFGRQVDSFEANLTVEGVEGPPFHAVFIRAPLIEQVFEPARAICTLEDGTIVAARQGNMLATSFHPELTGDTRLHQLFVTMGTAAAVAR